MKDQKQGDEYKAKMGIEAVINLANKVAEKQGIELSKFNTPAAHFNPLGKDNSWWVNYEAKRPLPGNHFTVVINDDSGEARYIPGK